MGVTPLFCCFRNRNPNCIAATGIGAGILSIAFLIWGIADLDSWRKGSEVIYIIAFVLIILAMLGFIATLIFPNLRKTESFKTINNFGRVFCFTILIMCAIALIFIFISFIINIVDYADEEKDRGKGRQIPKHEWAAVFVPSIITLACLIVMALAANILYKIFTDNILSTPYPVNITQTTNPNIPEITQPPTFPNNAPVYPMANNQGYPVIVKQSQVNLNN